jgi:C4-dicarboxylate transporter DctM subunit
VFAALTGSSPATSAAIGRIAIPEMTKRGYPNGLATGAIVAGGTLGILIPPSVTLILYGIATETSIGRLFLGGVVPGIMVTLLFCLWILVAVFLDRASGHSQQQTSSVGESDETTQTVGGEEGYSWQHRFGVLTKVIPFAVLIACVLGVLYLGIATPSEAAGVGALLSLILVALLYRSVNLRNLMDVALETTRTSTMILMIVAFSAVLGQILSFLNVPQELAQLVADLQVNRWVVFVIMNLLFLFLGFFIPPVAIILVTMPVLFPIITELGFDPIWFGVVMTLNMEMGLITPPVGLNLYVVQGIAPDIPLRDILAGSLPYVGVLALGIIILALFPGLVTWLPNQTLGG